MQPNNRQDCDLDLSRAAYEQIKLIMENDYTMQDNFFRLKIGGKGCDGFTYELGFTEKDDEDLELKYEDLIILIDPFTFHYCKEGYIDFLLNPKTNEDGFIFVNKNEDKYHGKFFKDEEMVPDHLGK